MKVPELPQATAQSSPLYQGGQPSLVRANGAVGQALEGAAAELQQSDNQVQRALAGASAEQQRADAIRESMAMVELDKRATRRLVGDSDSPDAAFEGKPLGGFFTKKGVEASESSAQVLAELEKDKTEIADSLNPRQREGFMRRAAAAYEGYRRQVETHTSKEIEQARRATVDATQKLGLQTIANNANDERLIESTSATTEAQLKKMALSPEDADAAIEHWRAQSALTQISRHIADGNIDTAEKKLEAFQQSLGELYPRVKSQVEQAKAGLKRDDEKVRAEATVQEMLNAGREADGYVNESAVLSGLEKVPTAQRDMVRGLLKESLAVEEGKRRADIDEWRRQARGLYNFGGLAKIPGALVEKLNRYDPEYLARLLHETEARADAARHRARTGSNADDRREQNEIDEAFRYRLEANLTRDANASPDDVRQQFILDYSKKYGRAVDISDSEWERAGATSGRVQKRAGTAEEAQDKSDSLSLTATIRAAAKRRKSKTPLDEGDVDAWTGRALKALRDRESEKKRRLTADERAAFDAELDMDVADSLKGGRLVANPETLRVVPRPAKKGALEMPELDLTQGADVTIRRKSDKKTRTLPAADAARFLADPNYEQVN